MQMIAPDYVNVVVEGHEGAKIHFTLDRDVVKSKGGKLWMPVEDKFEPWFKHVSILIGITVIEKGGHQSKFLISTKKTIGSLDDVALSPMERAVQVVIVEKMNEEYDVILRSPNPETFVVLFTFNDRIAAELHALKVRKVIADVISATLNSKV